MNRFCFAALALLLFTNSHAQLNFENTTQVLHWRNIGPANQGGRIVDIEALNHDYRKVWAATGSGGIWFSDNAGTTWQPIFDKYATASIGDIAVHQKNPNIIWVGTGEANGRNSVSWGDGVYRSTDGGRTFSHVGLKNSQQIARVILHPENPDVAYVAAMGHLWGYNDDRGLYKTIDGGKTWNKLSNGIPANDKEGCIDIVMHPQNPDMLYAAFYHRLRKPYHFESGSSNGGIFKSNDGGKSWTKLTNGLPTGATGRIGLAISASNPNIVMAIVEAKRSDNLQTPGSGIYRSENNGESWQYVNTYNNRPFYYSQIRIHPKNPNNVYVLTTPFMVSSDAGKTFTNGSDDEEIHGDFHAMWLDPSMPDRYYIGADKGISITHDGGKKFILFDNLPIAQYYRIAADRQKPYTVYGGLQDNGFYATKSFARDVRGILNDANWKVHWGDGQYTAVNPDNANEVYTSAENGAIRKLNPTTHELQNIAPDIFNIQQATTMARKGTSQPFLRFNWSAPFFLSAHDNKTLYMGSQYVMKSADGGAQWQIISPDLSYADSSKIKTGQSGGITPDNTGAENYGTVYALSQSPIDKNVLWAGTDDGRLHVTLNEGKTWQCVSDGWDARIQKLWIDRVVASAHHKQRAYVTIDGHRSDVFAPMIMMTNDGGKTWQSIVANLPATEVLRAFVEDAVNEDLLFAGTETGVWCSTDRGVSWQRFNKNLPTVSVYDLLIHPQEKDLIAATHGRSLWVMDDIGYLQQLTPELQKKDAWLFAQKPVTLWQNTSRGGQRGHFWYGGENPPGITTASSLARGNFEQSAMITVMVNSAQPVPLKLIISDDKSKRSAAMDTVLPAGIHRIPWNLHYDAPLIDAATIDNLEKIIKEIPGVERGTLTTVRRLKEATTAAAQREQMARLSEEYAGIQIAAEWLPYKAVAGKHTITLSAGDVTQKQTLVLEADPLQK